MFVEGFTFGAVWLFHSPTSNMSSLQIQSVFHEPLLTHTTSYHRA